ncbi:MAG: hypothetical protein NT068_04005 [Candidatus Nomurabacteria bacterium]|nr:hypothetical protein [Candidatus Nomurabacteria bacterium]
MNTTLEITGGPSREELFDGLRLLSEKRQIPFTFKATKGTELIMPLVTMQSIAAEDGSGHSWNITFLVKKCFVVIGSKDESLVTVKAYYSSMRRKGTVTYQFGE